jgi:hypothetical protein
MPKYFFPKTIDKSISLWYNYYRKKEREITTMTIREYFNNPAMTEEEFLNKMTEEVELWDAIENDEDFDLDEWAQVHDVDLDAIDEKTGETVYALWAWDMCGE